MLNLIKLEEFITNAYNDGTSYIAIEVKMPGFSRSEIIINESPNFMKKLEYYKKAYNNDLTLKNCPDIKIISVSAADTFQELEDCLCLV